MNERETEIAKFLKEAGWGGADEMPVPADFSSRRFARYMRAGEPARAILLDAADDPNNEQFVIIASLLRKLDISAPEIYAADLMHGLILMEDFGSRNIGRSADAGTDTAPFYRHATDVLVHLHKNFAATAARDFDLPVFGAGLFASQVELFLDYYFPFAAGREANREESESFRAAWKSALKGIDALPQTLMLRDYMLDNLMELPNHERFRSIGVLDFQDGGLGPAAYDLASLCETVRRDAPEDLLDEMVDHYCARTGGAPGETRRICRILSAQRHIRILGIIARLAQDGRREKLAYEPRIWKWLDRLLEDEALKPVGEWAKQNLRSRA